MAKYRRRRRARSNWYGTGVMANRRRRRAYRRNVYYQMNKHRKHRRRYYARNRKRHYRRNMDMYFPNRKRRRSYRRNYRRHYRRNPGMMGRGITIFGITLPPLDAILFVAAGFFVPNIVASRIVPLLPDSLKSRDATGALVVPTWLMWIVKAVSVVVPSMIVRRFVSRRAGNLMLIGGAASFAIDVIKTVAPGMIPGLGYQPMIGSYFARPQRGRLVAYPAQSRALGPGIAETPERLDPSGRF